MKRSAPGRTRSVDTDHEDGTEQVRKKAKRSFKKTKKKCKHKHQPGGEEEEDSSPAPVCETTEMPGSAAHSAGRQHTVSIALPGSIIDNAQNLELRTYLAGQIARAAVVFNVDEIVVYDEVGSTGKSSLPSLGKHHSDPNLFMARILQYLETPQYLRKALFPMHPDLKYVGLLNPLDCPHHMRVDDESEYREGVVLDRPIRSTGKFGSYVDCGMRKNVQIDKQLKPGVRVTVKLQEPTKQNPKYYTGHVVSPSAPRTESGIYWGYRVRLSHSFGAAFTEAPFEEGYDLTIGTSERGESIDRLTELPKFRHLLVVFGGLKGLEYSLECDESLHVDDVSLLFHHYFNSCPGQGSRTIRTEEAIPITLSALRPLIANTGLRTS